MQANLTFSCPFIRQNIIRVENSTVVVVIVHVSHKTFWKLWLSGDDHDDDNYNERERERKRKFRTGRV